MIQVKLPDGSIAQFPDGTPDDVMTRAIQQQQLGPSNQGQGPTTIANAPQEAQPAPQTYAQGVPSQALSGVNEGLAGTLGFPVDAVQGILRAGAAGLHAVGGPDIQLPVDAFGGSQTFKNLMGPAITPPTADPTAQFARRVGQEVGAAAVPMMGAAATSSKPLADITMQLGSALAGGTGAATANQVAPNNKYADLAGELLGSGLFAGGSKLAQKLITPNPIDPNRAAMNDVMAREGVDLTAGQKTGNPSVKYMESELGGQQAQAMTERQQEQFTQAALAKAGVQAQRATPEVMNQAFTDIGKQFDDLAANNVMIPDKQLGADVRQVWTQYQDVAGTDAKPVIGNAIQDIASWAQNGAISGEQYQALRTRLGTAARSTTSPELKGAIRGLQDAMDSAMERTIAASNPGDLGAWQQVRNDYRNLLVIEKAAAGPGEGAAMGLISPSKLRTAVAAQGTRAYIRGQGDFADLARAGEATMKPLPQSGTAPRMAARNIGMAIPSVMGSALGGSVGSIPGAVAGAAVGAAAPWAVGKVLMSGPGQRYLANQVWTTPLSAGTAMMPSVAAALVNQAKPDGSQR